MPQKSKRHTPSIQLDRQHYLLSFIRRKDCFLEVKAL